MYRTQAQNLEDAQSKLQEYIDLACVVPKVRKFKAAEESSEQSFQRIDRKRKTQEFKRNRG